jgi:RNA-binding protein YhbY
MVQQIKKLQIGKNGLTSEFIEQVKNIFKNERMLKISILKSACRDKTGAKEIAEELVGVLGKRYDYKLIGYVLTVSQFRKEQR